MEKRIRGEKPQHAPVIGNAELYGKLEDDFEHLGEHSDHAHA